MSKRRISKKSGWVDPCSLPKGPNGRALCRFCYREVPRGRRTFCSDVCVHHHKLRTRPAYVRQCLAKRDKGVCAVCGLDTQTTARQMTANRPGGVQQRKEWERDFEAKLGAAPGSRRYFRYWDADHIKPVAEGGGECGLGNYQTLCILCHKKKTAEQHTRAAQQRHQAEETPMANEKPNAKELQDRLKEWMTDSDNNPHRLVSASKLAELAKAMDPDIRGAKKIQAKLVREVALMLKKAMMRCYDNKRATLRDSDI